MKPGERIQWACGHWLVAGEFGLQDDYAQEMTRKLCGECQRRLKDAAPQLLEALEDVMSWLRERPAGIHPKTVRGWAKAEAAIKSAIGNRDPVE